VYNEAPGIFQPLDPLQCASTALWCHCFAAMKRESSSLWRRMTSAKGNITNGIADTDYSDIRRP